MLCYFNSQKIGQQLKILDVAYILQCYDDNGILWEYVLLEAAPDMTQAQVIAAGVGPDVYSNLRSKLSQVGAGEMPYGVLDILERLIVQLGTFFIDVEFLLMLLVLTNLTLYLS